MQISARIELCTSSKNCRFANDFRHAATCILTIVDYHNVFRFLNHNTATNASNKLDSSIVNSLSLKLKQAYRAAVGLPFPHAFYSERYLADSSFIFINRSNFLFLNHSTTINSLANIQLAQLNLMFKLANRAVEPELHALCSA